MLATLGQPLFEPLTNLPTAKGEKELFYCKGSRGRAEIVASIQGTSNELLRNQLALDEVKRQAVGLTN